MARQRIQGHWGQGYYALDEEGWKLYDLDRDDDPVLSDSCRVCLVGSLQWALTGCPTSFPAEAHLGDLYEGAVRSFKLAGRSGSDPSDLVFFNDNGAQTEANVLNALDRTIEHVQASV